MEIGGDPRRWLAALGIFCFWGRKKEFTTEDTEATEKRRTRIGRGDWETLGRKSPPFAKFAKGGGTLEFICDLMLVREPKRAT
jgi:hypothetical protein